MNIDNILKLKKLLKKSGYIFFASDIEDYFIDVKNSMMENGLSERDFSYAVGYSITKYHRKALEAGRTPNFLVAAI